MATNAKLLLGLIALAQLASPAASIAAAAPARCAIYAHLSDPDPRGTNVRAGPSASAAVVMRLPHSVKMDGDDYVPEVTIVGFSQGWAQVRDAKFADYGSGADRLLFKGPGWIAGSLLSATLNHMEIRSAPNESAPVVARLMGEDWGPDSVQVLAIEDCIGDYAKVRAKLPGGRQVTGWADGLCSNQVTTCP